MANEQASYSRNFADNLFRDALVHPRNLHALLRETHPKVADRLDYSRVQELPRSYVVDDWRQRSLDVLLRLPYRDESGEVLVCIQVEHQSSPDQVMPLRMLVHSVLYWEKQWQTWAQDKDRPYGTPLKLTPVIPLVFYTGLDPWNANTELSQLFEAPEALKSFLPQWDTLIWPLSGTTPEELLAASEPFWHALAVIRATREDAAEYLKVLREAYARLLPIGLADKMYWQALAKIVVHWSIGKRPQSEHATITEVANKQHKGTNLQPEVQEMTKAAFKSYEEELTERLQAKFEEKGRAEGSLWTARTILRSQLEKKFNTLPQEVIEKIERADIDQLNAALGKVLTMQSLDELEFESN